MHDLSFFMDTPLSENRSNLLVYAVLIAAVFALVLGIVCLTKINGLSKKLGDVSVADLAVRLESIDQSAKTAGNDARAANTAVKNLAAQMQREIGNELTSIRAAIANVETTAKDAADKVANLGSRPPSGSTSTPGGSGGNATPQGELAPDGTYVIKSGDTLSKIGAQFGIPWQEIARANPGVDSNRLRPGQRIVIPPRQ